MTHFVANDALKLGSGELDDGARQRCFSRDRRV